MVAKVAVLLFAVCAIVAVSNVQGAPQFNPLEALTNVATQIRETANDGVGRGTDAIVSTFDEQKKLMDTNIASLQGVGEKGLEAGTNAFKTGVNGFLLPFNFIRNTLASGRTN